MKKLTLILALLSVMVLGAQTKGIVFETGNLASVLEKAKKENKLIFIDAYTTWCGPCKFMAKYIFTNDTVAQFFNSKFVNYKMDMEKGEGLDFAKKYQVNCYPNLIFIDGSGKLVHRGAGSSTARAFLTFAENALSPDKNFVAMKDGYEKNGINVGNVLDYITLMNNSCMDPSEHVAQYIKTLKEDALTEKTNWELIREYSNNYAASENVYFLKNIKMFEDKFGKGGVEDKISKLGASYFTSHLKSKDFNKAAYETAKKEFTALNWAYQNRVIFETDLKMYKRFDKAKYFALASTDFLTYNNNDAGALNSMAWKFYEEVSDKEQLKGAVNMAKRACELEPNYMYLDTYAAVLYKAGNYKEAETNAKLSIEKAQQAKVSADDYKDTAELLKKIEANLK